MTYLKIFELWSLALSIPLIAGAVFVAIDWWPQVKQNLKAVFGQAKPLSPQGWLLTGVTLGMVSIGMDNFYWTWPWSFSFMAGDATSWQATSAVAANGLTKHGILWNVPFRQMLGLVALYCHTRAVLPDESQPDISPVEIVAAKQAVDDLHLFYIKWFAIGFAFSGGLLLLRTLMP